MRLIIKDYLRTLREKDELDLLLCDLLRLSGFIIDSIPKSGNRQYGVDIQAHSKTELYLLVVKQKDIDRKNWDSGQNSVRQSMNEIMDVYLRNLSPQDRKRRIKIVVATNGDMEEAVRMDFQGYQNGHQKVNGKEAEILFWGIDEITDQVQKVMFSEILLPEWMQSQLRKALYYVEEPDYKRSYYEAIVDSYMERLIGDSTSAGRREDRKTLTSLLLCTSMIAKYAADAQRYRIATLVFEYATLRLWRWMLQHNKMEKDFYSAWIIKYYKQYKDYSQKYYTAIKETCTSPNGFPSYYNIVEQRIKLYEVVGQLTSFAYGLRYSYIDAEKAEAYEILGVIIHLINNHPQFYYAPYDSNIAQINMLLRTCLACGDKESARILINNLIHFVSCWFWDMKKYPTPADSFHDAINIELGNEHEEYQTSAFWGFMLLWIALLDDKEGYDIIRDFLENELKDVTKCLWFLRPDEEQDLYDERAMNKAGDGIAVDVRDDYAKFRKELLFIAHQYEDDEFSYEKYSFPAIEMIANHYFGSIPKVVV